MEGATILDKIDIYSDCPVHLVQAALRAVKNNRISISTAPTPCARSCLLTRLLQVSAFLVRCGVIEQGLQLDNAIIMQAPHA